MKALNVELPDVVTRVSEFIPEIIDFIKKIEEKGYAYRSNGSVYFNVSKFNDGTNHKYPKLLPTADDSKTKAELLKEGEGALAAPDQDKEKQNEQDFALWKKSKENEPLWESEFG
jgi:cysteinyl-tRNA synthetase